MMLDKPQNIHGKYLCACCGYFTITEIKETCPVCGWEEDNFQEENIDDDGGPNTVCLRQAKENFQNYGVMEERLRQYVRPPAQDEMPMRT